jgi:hypothetical protein
MARTWVEKRSAIMAWSTSTFLQNFNIEAGILGYPSQLNGNRET